MAKRSNSQYVCSDCGGVSIGWMGRCPECGQFGTMREWREPQGGGKSAAAPGAGAAQAEPLRDARPQELPPRVGTGIGELDRVLGGGLVPGSVILVGGEPGAGKSTLLLQACDRMAAAGLPVLLVSGEESADQIRLRAARLGCEAPGLFLLCENDLEAVLATAESLRPAFLVIDSIQTVACSYVDASPGGVTQVRESSLRLQRAAKAMRMTTCLVGHVTKEGSLAGPRIIEHLVDTVLYFEGERLDSFRMLRAVKNRFGSVSEVGIFEMGDAGLREVLNPSVLFMQARPEPVSGTAICATMEGRRPLLAEVQALVNPSHLPSPKRVAQGLDANRLAIDVAVLERRAGLRLAEKDVFVSVTGGLRVVEPALDLAVCMALASALRDRPLPAGTVYFGEVSLTGEIRPVSAAQPRLAEAGKMGLRRAVIPPDQGLAAANGMAVTEVRQLAEALARELG